MGIGLPLDVADISISLQNNLVLSLIACIAAAVIIVPVHAISSEPDLFADMIVSGNAIFHGMLFVDTICTTDGLCYGLKKIVKDRIPADAGRFGVQCPEEFPVLEVVDKNTFVCLVTAPAERIPQQLIPRIAEQSPLPEREPRAIAIQKAPFEFLSESQESSYRQWHKEFVEEVFERNVACEGQDTDGGHVSSMCSLKAKRLYFWTTDSTTSSRYGFHD